MAITIILPRHLDPGAVELLVFSFIVSVYANILRCFGFNESGLDSDGVYEDRYRDRYQLSGAVAPSVE